MAMMLAMTWSCCSLVTTADAAAFMILLGAGVVAGDHRHPECDAVGLENFSEIAVDSRQFISGDARTGEHRAVARGDGGGVHAGALPRLTHP